MTHFVRTHTDSAWTVGGAGNYVTLQSDWVDLANKVAKSVNGDKGGTWAPTSPIAISGSLIVHGPTVVDYGGSLRTASGARFILGPDQYPQFIEGHVGRTRTIMQNLLRRQSSPKYHWMNTSDYPGGIRSVACTINGPSGLEQPKFALPLRVHDGSRFVFGTLTFRIPVARTKAPLAMPKLRLSRTDAVGNNVPLTSVAAGADSDGWVSIPKVTDGSTWYANGEAQTFVVVADQNNMIDTSLYLYWLEYIEELGTDQVPVSGSEDGFLVRERKATVERVFITNVGLSTVPGGSSAGDPVLVTNESNALYFPCHGIWNVQTSYWTRRGDNVSSNQFTPGFILFDKSIWEMWELVSPNNKNQFIVAADSSMLTPGAAPIFFQRRKPYGNVLNSFSCSFDSIADMRPQ